jgi:hypothetical protein
MPETCADSDVDLLCKFSRKPVADYMTASNLRVAAAEKNGRRFGGFFERLEWPLTEVVLFLKNRSRALSLLQWNEECH